MRRTDDGAVDNCQPSDWFISQNERGNPDTELDRAFGPDAWTSGNRIVPRIHGVDYFAALVSELEQFRAGDAVYFTDWRGDHDQRLRERGPAIGDLLAGLAERGADVRGLVWRSHPAAVSFSEGSNRRLEAEINRRGGHVLLDQRVLRLGSHHQKLFVVHRRDGADVAFVGGIDLCHSRRDDRFHRGDPQQQVMDPRYGPRAPWHDIQLEVHGPAVAQLELCFRERWEDPTPLDDRLPWRWLIARATREPASPAPFPGPIVVPRPEGNCAVQVLRTYPQRRRPYPFARRGERSIARALIKAVGQAQNYIYIEDQYLWSSDVAKVLADRLRKVPDLQVIAVVPRYPDADGRLTGPPNRIGQLDAIAVLHQAGGGRVGIFDVESPQGWPTYVHAKVCIIDDVWALVGSANFNLRSWTHDSELACAVIDSTPDDREPATLGAGSRARRFARELRLNLWSEHLGVDAKDAQLLNPALDVWQRAAAELHAWRASGSVGEHPPSRVLVHRPDPVRGTEEWWVRPLSRTIYDPDGRSRRERARHTF